MKVTFLVHVSLALWTYGSDSKSTGTPPATGSFVDILKLVKGIVIFFVCITHITNLKWSRENSNFNNLFSFFYLFFAILFSKDFLTCRLIGVNIRNSSDVNNFTLCIIYIWFLILNPIYVYFLALVLYICSLHTYVCTSTLRLC